VSLRLCGLVFSNADRCADLTEIILPLLTTIDRDHLMLPHMRDSDNNIATLYPQQTLTILHTILPENVSAWPYGIEKTLQQIHDADCELGRDEIFLELKRKWNSR